jgi:Fe-S cluster assembly protein SufD
MNAVSERYLAEFHGAQTRLPGAGLPWLKRGRAAAIEQFAELGFPTTRQEDWKYTNLASLERQDFRLGTPSSNGVSREQIEEWNLAQKSHVLVFVDGHYRGELSRVGALPQGALVASLAQALASHAELLESVIAPGAAQPVFAALNTALFTDGALVYVPDGASIDEAIHLLFIGAAGGTMNHLRNVIIAGTEAQAKVVEHYVGVSSASYFTNAVTSVRAARGARIDHYKLQQESASAYHVGAIGAVQAQASAFSSFSFALGAALARNDIHTMFNGADSHCALSGLYLTADKQLVDHHTRIDHAQPRCMSREFYKGVLDGSSRAVFNGKVVVHKGAQQTDAHQTNKNLLLSETAEVDTKPELEIYADDVKCGHGATVGQLDDNQIFYLRSRGLDLAAARTLLTYAFAEDIVSAIGLQPVRERIEHIMVRRLPRSDLLKELL